MVISGPEEGPMHTEKAQNLKYHQERVDKTFKVFFPDFEPLNLNEIQADFPPNKEKTKCKLFYNGTFFNFECSKYEEKIYDKFKVVDAGEVDYSFKYSKRDFFEEVQKQYPDYGIIFVRNGKVTDTTYSNLVFQANDKWLTPDTVLLKGTQRERLIDEYKISESDVAVKELREFKKFKLINSMLDIENSTEYYCDMIEF